MTTDVKDGVKQLTGILQAQNKMEEADILQVYYIIHVKYKEQYS